MPLVIKTTGFEDYLDRSGGAYIKALILGAPNAGKTRSASFWPKPIFADCEKGRMSIADRGVPFAEVRSSAEMDALLQHLQIDARKPVESRKYLTFVIDTIDSYQRVLIRERLAKEKKEALSGWADWGFLDAKMTQLLEALLNLPMNIIVNVHVKDEKDGDEDSAMLIHRPKLKGDIKDQIAGEFDLVGQMETYYTAEKGERTLKRHIRWHSEPRYPLLKDRSGQLPRFTPVEFSEQDYDGLFKIIVGRDDLDEMPEATTVESLGTAEDSAAEPAAPDTTGGPVEVGNLPPKPVKKAAAKKAAPAAKVPLAKDVKPEPVANPATPSEPEPEPDASPATDVASTQEQVSDAEGIANVQEQLGGTEVAEEEPAADEPPTAPAAGDGIRCGDQPAHLTKYPAAPGCGRDASYVPTTQMNLRKLKTKTQLCDDCFAAWQSAS